MVSATPTKKNQPIIAFVGRFDKHNEPIIMREYLVDHVRKENQERIQKAESALSGSDEDLNKVKAIATSDTDSIAMQLQMLVYSTMDVFNEKAQIIPDRVKA